MRSQIVIKVEPFNKKLKIKYVIEPLCQKNNKYFTTKNFFYKSYTNLA